MQSIMLCNLLSVKVTRNVNAIMRIFRLYKQKSSCGTAKASARMILKRRRRYHWPRPSNILGRRNNNFYSLNLSKQKYQITLLLFVKASFVQLTFLILLPWVSALAYILHHFHDIFVLELVLLSSAISKCLKMVQLIIFAIDRVHLHFGFSQARKG